MCKELEDQKEAMYENFTNFCDDNPEFSDKLVEYFGEPFDHYMVWKEDDYDWRRSIEDNAFNKLFDFDDGHLLYNVESCLAEYVRCTGKRLNESTQCKENDLQYH